MSLSMLMGSQHYNHLQQVSLPCEILTVLDVEFEMTPNLLVSVRLNMSHSLSAGRAGLSCSHLLITGLPPKSVTINLIDIKCFEAWFE